MWMLGLVWLWTLGLVWLWTLGLVWWRLGWVFAVVFLFLFFDESTHLEPEFLK